MPPRVKKKSEIKKKKGEKAPPKEEKPKEPEQELPSAGEGLLDPGVTKIEPGPDDEIGPGEVDAAGNYFMEELDFLRLQSRKERKSNCSAQAEALRAKAELIRMKLQAEQTRFLNQAAAMDRAALAHDNVIQEQLTELSKKYDIDFKDPTVHVDDEFGKIIATDPEKGLPRLSRRE